MAAVDTLKAYGNSNMSKQKALSDLNKSLDDAYNLYLSMFVLITELTDEQIVRHEAAKAKYLATAEDLNPNTRLVDNKFAAYLREDPTICKFVKATKISWVESPGLMKNLLDAILASDIYREYIEAPEADWHADCEFWRNILRNVVMPSDALDEAIEGKSIFWNDDLNIVGTFVLKTIRRFSVKENSDEEVEFLPQFKDEEDAMFGERLFNLAVAGRDEYRAYIDRYISKDWDPDRLAFMDIVIMIAAITEIVNFDTIPLPVSLNEYIEIANNYSTRRSGPFINGILFSVVKTLADEGRLSKPFSTAQDPTNQE